MIDMIMQRLGVTTKEYQQSGPEVSSPINGEVIASTALEEPDAVGASVAKGALAFERSILGLGGAP